MTFTSLYRLIGSIYFALILMSLLISSVAIATWIESATDSHLQAAQWVYRSPLFSGILIALFLNILFSASRRWPFKWKHLPFLLAHLGLLMLLTGVIWKQFFGLQGHIVLLEGMGSHHLIIPEKVALSIEKRPSPKEEYSQTAQFEIASDKKINTREFDSDLEVTLLKYWPHGVARNEAWIKGNHLWIFGQPPLEIDNFEQPLLLTQAAELPTWRVFATQSDDIADCIKTILLKQATLKVIDIKTREIVESGPLQQFLSKGVVLDLDYSPLHAGLQFPYKKEIAFLPLTGKQALITSSAAIELALELPPALLFVEDYLHTVHLIAISQFGELWAKSFPIENLGSVIIYDRGFSGYGLETEVPLLNVRSNNQDRLKARAYARIQFLKESVHSETPLLPPIKLLKRATLEAETDFASTVVEFFWHWKNHRNWLLKDDIAFSPELRKTLDSITWDDLNPNFLQACDWIPKLFQELDLNDTSETAYIQLRKKQWPLLNQIEASLPDINDDAACRQLLTQQIFDFCKQESSLNLPLPPQASASERLTTLLRLYDFSWQALFEMGAQEAISTLLDNWHEALKNEENLPEWLSADTATLEALQSHPALHLETALTTVYQPLTPLLKLEENRPLVQLRFKKGSKQELATIGLDTTQSLFKQPILGGNYRIHLEPLQVEIPYHIRLLDARQIMHPDSAQTSSYECKILVKDRESGHEEEGILSMNRVFETKRGGYRFYLSGMAPAQEIAPRQVNLVVNRDPVRWIFTYPGAFFIALGTVLLLWMRPYAKYSSN